MSKISLCYYCFNVNPIDPNLNAIIKGVKTFCKKKSNEIRHYNYHFYFRRYNNFKIELHCKISLTANYDEVKDMPSHRYVKGECYEISSSSKESVLELSTKLKLLTTKLVNHHNTDFKNKKLNEVSDAINKLSIIYDNIDEWNRKN